jgi:formylmethanofuran dehydrogenase subunit E
MAATARAGPASLTARSLDELVAEAVAFHGHECPGIVLGVRMVLAGCRALGVDCPRAAGKDFVVIAEIARCAIDAIEVLTGASLGKRTLHLVDYGKMAATFVQRSADRAVRVAALDAARWLASAWWPSEPDPRRRQMLAYRALPDADLLAVVPVRVRPAWFAPRVRVFCARCGEGVHYRREVVREGRLLCRACAGESYYDIAPHSV